jgi:D-alanine--poly(phosphoribitol) ligase subunit 1
MKILNTIKDIALTQPETLAFISSNKTITYNDLWKNSDQIAAFILNLDLKRSSPVLVYGHMEPEMLISFIGSVKTGHPYIPVDCSIPLERIVKIVESSQTELIINVTNQPLVLDDLAVRIVNHDEIMMKPQSQVEISSDHWVKGEENFYIIYTSGSTGNPKGVQISANNLQSFVNWMVEDFPIKGQLRFLNQAPFSFDLSVMDLYPALTSGGTIFAINKEMIAKPKILFEAFAESNIQVWTSTPSFVQMCLMDPSFNENLLPNLTVFLFCGEILPAVICQQLMERFPKAKIFNTYGPTEATVAVTSIEVSPELLNEYTSLPVGRIKTDSRILLVDENGNEVPNDEKGEIILVGPSVSKGYLGQQELTNKAFFKYDGEQAYKTGDAGYKNHEGLLFYKGRMDFQIKLHGYRMELEEIEYHIAKSKYVKTVVVIPIYQNDKIEYLSASIVPEQHGFEKDYQLTGAIKKELANVLPVYMIPRKFSYHEELPITSNGKIDRKQIREMVLL